MISDKYIIRKCWCWRSSPICLGVEFSELSQRSCDTTQETSTQTDNILPQNSFENVLCTSMFRIPMSVFFRWRMKSLGLHLSTKSSAVPLVQVVDGGPLCSQDKVTDGSKSDTVGMSDIFQQQLNDIYIGVSQDISEKTL